TLATICLATAAASTRFASPPSALDMGSDLDRCCGGRAAPAPSHTRQDTGAGPREQPAVRRRSGFPRSRRPSLSAFRVEAVGRELFPAPDRGALQPAAPEQVMDEEDQ